MESTDPRSESVSRVRHGYETMPAISSNNPHHTSAIESRGSASGSLPTGLRLPVKELPLPYTRADREADMAESRTGLRRFLHFVTKNRTDGRMASQQTEQSDKQSLGLTERPLVRSPLTASGSGTSSRSHFWQFQRRKQDRSSGATGVDERSESSCLGGRLKRNTKSCAEVKSADVLRNLPTSTSSVRSTGSFSLERESGLALTCDIVVPFDAQLSINDDNADGEIALAAEGIASDAEVVVSARGVPQTSMTHWNHPLSAAPASRPTCHAPVALPPTDLVNPDTTAMSAPRRGPYPRVQCGGGAALLAGSGPPSSTNSLASFGATGAATLSVTGVAVPPQVSTAAPPHLQTWDPRAPPHHAGTQNSLFHAQTPQILDQRRLISTTVYPDTSGDSSDVLVVGDGLPALVPRTVHTQIDYVHCLVPDLHRIAACAYYWGVMDRYEAERALDGRPEGTFLLRDSAQDDFLFSVSFRRYGRSLHARVEQWNHRFSFDAHDTTVFSSPSVCELVEHYKDPASCLFFEPMLTAPLPRRAPFSLQVLCRTVVCATTTYDGVAVLPLPAALKTYLQHYHYKQRVRVRRFEAPPPPPVRATTA